MTSQPPGGMWSTGYVSRLSHSRQGTAFSKRPGCVWEAGAAAGRPQQPSFPPRVILGLLLHPHQGMGGSLSTLASVTAEPTSQVQRHHVACHQGRTREAHSFTDQLRAHPHHALLCLHFGKPPVSRNLWRCVSHVTGDPVAPFPSKALLLSMRSPDRVWPGSMIPVWLTHSLSKGEPRQHFRMQRASLP